MKKLLLNLSVYGSIILSCFCGHAIGDVKYPLPSEETAAIESFFKDFVTAFNANDVENVKRMVGKTWEHWSKNINGNEKIGGIDIVEIKAGTKRVVAKITAVRGKRLKSAEVIFTLIKKDGKYCIGDMVFPIVEKRNQEFRSATDLVEKLVVAINACDVNAVKNALTFKDTKDFEKELSLRGLLWIKNAIDNSAKTPLEAGGVRRERNGMLVGRVYVPCASGGTNVLQQFVFKDLKIDRAAPREETKDEFLKRFEKEKEGERIKYQAEKAEQERRKYEEALKFIQQQIK